MTDGRWFRAPQLSKTRSTHALSQSLRRPAIFLVSLSISPSLSSYLCNSADRPSSAVLSLFKAGAITTHCIFKKWWLTNRSAVCTHTRKHTIMLLCLSLCLTCGKCICFRMIVCSKVKHTHTHRRQDWWHKHINRQINRSCLLCTVYMFIMCIMFTCAHKHVHAHTHAVHLEVLSYVLFWVHPGDFQLTGKANGDICIYSAQPGYKQ